MTGWNTGLLASFGSGEDVNSSGSEIVDMKVYLSREMRDELDRMALKKFGRGRKRNDIVLEALRSYMNQSGKE